MVSDVNPNSQTDRDFVVMGVVNVTPDSFSDAGRYFDPSLAVRHGLALEAEGAAILDVGGESTRPGADPVEGDEESRRVVPVIEALVAAGVRAQISIDTMKAEVAERALAAGATLVNDVTALRAAPRLAELTAAAGAELCLMHMQHPPNQPPVAPRYADIVAEVKSFLEERMAFAVAHGVPEEKIILDPGFGGGSFGKDLAQNLELLRRLPELVALGRPILVGTSRKGFLGELTGRPVTERVAATIATNVIAYEHGVRMFRVHDVAPLHDALTVTAATVAG
ncbi:MAG TPA: dihydropteroate synthase [Solirubrobacteraceae bacterium]|jgi:dihydropteroate synthase|nr:dihydropteroate synthase [Solirubrobacteraceae bacterium]